MSKIIKLLQLIVLIGFLVAIFFLIQGQPVENIQPIKGVIVLPTPETTGNISVEDAINKRKSISTYQNKSLTLKDISQLLWAAQGITDKEKNIRTVPSAGATYPLEIYILTGTNGVNGLESGLYHYNPLKNQLEYIMKGDLRVNLSSTAYGQGGIANAPAIIIITGVYSRTQNRYGDRGIQFVHMEAGHAGQNLYLQAQALDLGMVLIGGFSNKDAQKILKLPADQEVLYLIPVGHPTNS